MSEYTQEFVIELDERAVTKFVQTLRHGGWHMLADRIEREFAPRIPEPGWGAVVEAGVKGREGRCLFSRVVANGVPMWQSQDGRTWVMWASLIDPVVKREAVES